MSVLNVRPIVFGYNFPHKKTQDFLQRLVLLGAKPALVLLADPVKLHLPPAALRTKPRHGDLIHPQKICDRFGLPSRVMDHTSDDCVELLREHRAQVGIVAGARILPRKVIDCFEVGVVNFHPGLIPEVRGLDALPWALHLGLPLGVTAHLIDHKVDAGRIIQQQTITEYVDDTLIDLSLRLYETQLQMLEPTLEAVVSHPSESFELVTGGDYRRSFPAEFAVTLPQKLAARQARLSRAA